MSAQLHDRLASWNNFVPNEWIFMKFNIAVVFEKSVEKIQVSLKYDKHNEYFT
jgi:hypothetical protein